MPLNVGQICDLIGVKCSSNIDIACAKSKDKLSIPANELDHLKSSRPGARPILSRTSSFCIIVLLNLTRPGARPIIGVSILYYPGIALLLNF
jgi:hypothetical protein